jgi:hypothetical protein
MLLSTHVIDPSRIRIWAWWTESNGAKMSTWIRKLISPVCKRPFFKILLMKVYLPFYIDVQNIKIMLSCIAFQQKNIVLSVKHFFLAHSATTNIARRICVGLSCFKWLGMFHTINFFLLKTSAEEIIQPTLFVLRFVDSSGDTLCATKCTGTTISTPQLNHDHEEF